MKWAPILLIFSLTACSEYASKLDPQLRDIAEPLIARASQHDASAREVQFLQPAAYSAIANTNLNELNFLFESNARRLSLSNFGSQQLLYPQLTPGGQARLSGGVALTLNVSQVLYDGGSTAARQYQGETDAIRREIETLEILNQDIEEDIAIYFDNHKNIETVAALSKFVGDLQGLLDLAETRFRGGVGAASEVSLFELQLAELRTDIAIAKSNAELAMSRLDAHDKEVLSSKPVNLEIAQDRVPLSIMAALAEREANRSALEVAQSNLRPQVAGVANVGIDVQTGIPSKDIGLDVVVSEPITFGGNTALRVAQEELTLSELSLSEAVRDVELEVRQLLQEIDALTVQQRQTSVLARQAQVRLDSFQDRFLSGEASLTEAVSLIDTVRSSTESSIALKYRIMSAELQLAGLTSSLLPNFGTE